MKLQDPDGAIYEIVGLDTMRGIVFAKKIIAKAAVAVDFQFAIQPQLPISDINNFISELDIFADFAPFVDPWLHNTPFRFFITNDKILDLSRNYPQFIAKAVNMIREEFATGVEIYANFIEPEDRYFIETIAGLSIENNPQ